ncbi:MAG: TraR/DksA family transcriptional regulator [Rhizobiaceae bacterium]
MPKDPNTVRSILENLRESLAEESELADEALQTVELDQQAVGRLSRMDALQAQAMAQAQERKRNADLVRIDMALRRLEEGEYGYCAECGEEIPDARLEIDPMAERCINCA